MKKVLSVFLCLVICFTSVATLASATEVKAASYPSVIARNSVIHAYVGDVVPISFIYTHAYDYEKIDVNIYGPSGSMVASTTFTVDNSKYNYASLTTTWDTTNEGAGNYTVKVVKHYYASRAWRTAPNTSTSRIVLNRVTDNEITNNPYKGSKTHFNVSQNASVTATAKGIKNSYNAWKTINTKQGSVPYSVQLRELYIGDAAQKMALSENIYNAQGVVGCQWYIMCFRVKNKGSKTLKAGDLFDWAGTYLADGKKSTFVSTCTFSQDKNTHSTKIAPGETKDIWFGFYVLAKQGFPYIKLDNGVFLNVNPLCAKAHKYSNASDNTCNVCKATRAAAGKPAAKTVKTVKLSASTFVYNGKVRTPAVTVKDSAGKTLKNGKDYTVTYAKGRKNVGTYKVTVTMKGSYTGTKTLTFTIKPAGVSLNKITAGAKSFTAAWTPKADTVTGYEIQYSVIKGFSGAKTVTVSSAKTKTKAVKGLTKGKTYYVRIRTYKTVGKVKLYSAWSAAKTVKAK